MPRVSGEFQLEHSALIGVEEVLALGDPVSVRRTHRAALPAGRTNTSTMLPRFLNQVNAVGNPVLQPRGPDRD